MNETWWVNPSQLDDDQKAIVKLSGSGSYLIQGPPGSGKTNLLLLRAQYLVRSGKPDVLILVFNKTLQYFLSSGCDNYGFSENKIKTCSFWMHEFLRERSIDPPNYRNFMKQRLALTKMVSDIINSENLDNIYDAILIDEGQDFSSEEIELLAKIGSNIFIVADINQKIYQGVDVIEFSKKYVDETHKLNFHYRNGFEICRLAEEVMEPGSTFMSSFSNYDEEKRPSSVKLIRCNNKQGMYSELIESLRLQVLAYPDELLGVVCPTNKDLDEMWEYVSSTDLAEISIVQSSQNGYLKFSDEVKICFSTIHSAKGLEFRTLHLIDCDNLTKFREFTKRLSFTAITRAKTIFSAYYISAPPRFLEKAFSAISPPQSPPELADLFIGDN